MPDSVTGDRIVEYARTFLGVPYKVRGRSREGIDCAGLAICVGQHFGLTVDFTNYEKVIDFADVDRTLRVNGFVTVDPANLRIGDLMVSHVFNQARGVAIISRLGDSEFFGVSKIIEVDAVGRGTHVVEHEPRLSAEERLALFTYGLSLEALKRCVVCYRFPFAI